jgi:hypothetical protein
MQGVLALILFLMFCPQIGFCDLSCKMRTGVNYTDLQLGEVAMEKIKFSNDRNKTHLNVFQCKCTDEDQLVRCTI